MFPKKKSKHRKIGASGSKNSLYKNELNGLDPQKCIYWMSTIGWLGVGLQPYNLPHAKGRREGNHDEERKHQVLDLRS